MYKSSIRICLFVILFIAPLTLYAAGLGKLTLGSALGQPLRAEISLVAVNNNEIPSLSARLASPEAFAQAGVDYKPFLSTFKVSIEPRANGDPYIKITSPQAINEPFISMLVELNWASGRLLREYTVLLDPASDTPTTTAAPVLQSEQPVQQPQSQPQRASQGLVETPIVQYAVEQPVDAPQPDVVSSEPIYVDLPPDNYVVSKGETLSSIARQYLPYDADLNQMLVALYRANRDAFIQDNMNLLRTGAVLNLPTSDEVAAISKAEARSEIKIQVADWQAYRDRLAAAASGAGTQAEDVRKQTAEGQISTTVGDRAVAAKKEPEEVLRLSSGDPAAGDDVDDNETLARLRMMEEDSIARNLALKEANERVEMLEKNIENLQRLLELKDANLAKAQQQAEGIVDNDLIPETDMDTDTLSSDPVSELPEERDVAIDPDVELDAALDLDEPIEDEAVSAPSMPQPVPQPAPQPVEVSFVDQIIQQVMDNIEYVAGALGVLLLGILALFIKKRKNSEEDGLDDMDDMDFDEFPSSSATEASTATSNTAAAAAAGGVAAYALNEGVDAATNDEDDQPFDEEVAKPDDAEEDTDFFLDDDVQDEEKAVEETSVDLSEEATQEDVNASDDLDDSEHELENDTTESDVIEDSADSHEVEFDLGDSDEASAAQDEETELADAMDLSDSAEPDTEETEQDSGLDFELDDSSDDQASEEAPSLDLDSTADDSNEIAFTEEEDVSSLELDDEPVDDDVALTDEMDAVSDDASESAQVPPLELDDIDLNLDEPESEPELEPESEPEAEFELDADGAEEEAVQIDDEVVEDDQSEADVAADSSDNDTVWQEVETKIDLAKAYQELEDKEGAREILEEVLRDGDDDQKQKAESMLAEL